MKSLILLILFFVHLSRAEEVTSPMGDVYYNTEQTSPSENSDCPGVEASFKDHMLKTIGSAEEQYKNSYECLAGATKPNGLCEKLNSENLKAIKNYRTLMKTLYQEIANKWVQQRSQPSGGISTACYGNSVQFDDHIRNLKVIADDPTMCVGEANDWSANRDTTVMKYLNSEIPSTSLSSTQIKALKEFHHLPWMIKLGDEPKFRQSVTDAQLKSDLSKTFQSIHAGIVQFKQKITALEPHEYYKLYDFGNQFEVFKKGSPQISARAESCKNSSSFLKDCASGELSRCGSRGWGIAKEFLPILPLIDGIKGISDVRSAVAAGVMTRDEAIAAQSNNVMGILTGGGLTTAAAGGAKLALKGAKAAAQGAEALAAKAAARYTSRAKGMTTAALKAEQNANRALTDPKRLKALEDFIGRPLSKAEQEKLLKIHNTLCAKADCTATEIRDLKGLAEVKAMFPDMDPQQIKDMYRLGYLGRDDGYSGSVSFQAPSSWGTPGSTATMPADYFKTNPDLRLMKLEDPAQFKTASNYFNNSAATWARAGRPEVARVEYLRAGNSGGYVETFLKRTEGGGYSLRDTDSARAAITKLENEIKGLEFPSGRVNVPVSARTSFSDGGEALYSRAYYDHYIAVRKQAIKDLNEWLAVAD